LLILYAHNRLNKTSKDAGAQYGMGFIEKRLGDMLPSGLLRKCATAVSAVSKFANGLVSRTAETAVAPGTGCSSASTACCVRTIRC